MCFILLNLYCISLILTVSRITISSLIYLQIFDPGYIERLNNSVLVFYKKRHLFLVLVLNQN